MTAHTLDRILALMLAVAGAVVFADAVALARRWNR